MPSRITRSSITLARRAFLASLIAAGAVTTGLNASGEVVDIPTQVLPVAAQQNPVASDEPLPLSPPSAARPSIAAPGGQPSIAPPVREFPDGDDAALPNGVPNRVRTQSPATRPAQGPNQSQSNVPNQTLPPPNVPVDIAPLPIPLNADPNANINDILPPGSPVGAAPLAQNFATGRQQGLGFSSASFSSAPNMIGDLFGGGLSVFQGAQTVSFSGHAPGTILSGGPGAANSQIAFEFGGDIVPDDVFTTGLGQDLAGGDGFADTFQIAEPIPPTDVPTSPGPGFTFDGGTAVYTNSATETTAQPGQYQNGDLWYIDYSYTQSLLPPDAGGRPIPAPGVSVRRLKLSENFSPEVRDRCFASFNFFNDAYGGLGDVSRYTLGAERILVDEIFSVEARLLMAGTYASTQVLERPEGRDFELGNAGFIAKAVLLRTNRMIWSGGFGFTIPTADDTRFRSGGEDVLVIKNRTFHLLPFSAMLWKLNRDTAFQAYMQLDIAANGDPIYGNLAGGSLPKLGVFNDSSLMNLDFAMSHVMYRGCKKKMLRQVIANGEIHYTGSLQESDIVTSEGLTYTNLSRYFNVLNATAGCHFVLGDNVVVTPAMSIPLRERYDEQYDYEAIVQVNYLH